MRTCDGKADCRWKQQVPPAAIFARQTRHRQLPPIGSVVVSSRVVSCLQRGESLGVWEGRLRSGLLGRGKQIAGLAVLPFKLRSSHLQVGRQIAGLALVIGKPIAGLAVLPFKLGSSPWKPGKADKRSCARVIARLIADG